MKTRKRKHTRGGANVSIDQLDNFNKLIFLSIKQADIQETTLYDIRFLRLIGSIYEFKKLKYKLKSQPKYMYYTVINGKVSVDWNDLLILLSTPDLVTPHDNPILFELLGLIKKSEWYDNKAVEIMSEQFKLFFDQSKTYTKRIILGGATPKYTAPSITMPNFISLINKNAQRIDKQRVKLIEIITGSTNRTDQIDIRNACKLFFYDVNLSYDDFTNLLKYLEKMFPSHHEKFNKLLTNLWTEGLHARHYKIPLSLENFKRHSESCAVYVLYDALFGYKSTSENNSISENNSEYMEYIYKSKIIIDKSNKAQLGYQNYTKLAQLKDITGLDFNETNEKIIGFIKKFNEEPNGLHMVV